MTWQPIPISQYRIVFGGTWYNINPIILTDIGANTADMVDINSWYCRYWCQKLLADTNSKRDILTNGDDNLKVVLLSPCNMLTSQHHWPSSKNLKWIALTWRTLEHSLTTMSPLSNQMSTFFSTTLFTMPKFYIAIHCDSLVRAMAWSSWQTFAEDDNIYVQTFDYQCDLFIENKNQNLGRLQRDTRRSKQKIIIIIIRSNAED